MRFFNGTLRFLLALSVISSVVFYNYDFKLSIITLSIVYFFQFLIIYPVLKDSIFRYFLYILDFSFLFYIILVTDNAYLSLFSLLFLTELKRNIEKFLIFIPAIATVGFGFYKSGFYDLTLIYLSVGILVSIVYFTIEKEGLKKSLSKTVDMAKNIYRDNLICNDKMDFYMRYYNIISSLKKLTEDKINPEDLKKILFQNLNCDAVIILDKYQDSLHLDGTLDIQDTEEIKNYIKNSDIYNLKKALNVRYSIIRDFDRYIIVLLYKDYILIDKELLEAIG